MGSQKDPEKEKKRITRSELKDALKDLGVRFKLVNLPPMMTMTISRAKVKVDKMLSDHFQIISGVKQRDGLFTALFNITQHKAIQPIDQRGIIFNKSTQICSYSEDDSVVTRTKEGLTEIYKDLERNAKELGFAFNMQKTVYMKISASDG